MPMNFIAESRPFALAGTRPHRHRVVVCVDQVDGRVRRQRRLHLCHRLFAQPVGDRVVDDPDAGKAGNRFTEPFTAVARRSGTGKPLDLHDRARAAQQRRDVLAGRLADVAIVGADERRVGLSFDLAIEYDNRDPALEGTLHDGRERLRFVR